MLKLASKGAVRFEWSDGIEETTITLNPGDDEETLKRKLERVLGLSRPELPVREPGASLPPGVPAYAVQPANGWAAMPPIPARLEGKVELIPPEEQS